MTVVSDKVAALEEAQTFIRPTRMRVYGAAGIADDVRTALLPKLTLGSLARERLDAAVLDLDPVNETAGFLQSGILGANFLRYFRLIFDFQRGILRLEPLDASTLQNDTVPQTKELAQ